MITITPFEVSFLVLFGVVVYSVCFCVFAWYMMSGD